MSTLVSSAASFGPRHSPMQVSSQPPFPHAHHAMALDPHLPAAMSPSFSARQSPYDIHAAAAAAAAASYFDRASPPFNAPPPPPVDVYSHQKSGVPRSSFPPPCLASYMSYGALASSASPPTRAGRPPGMASSPSSHYMSSPLQHATSIMMDPEPPRSASAVVVDAAAAAQSASSPAAVGHMVQRLAHQNSLIRDAWEMERSHLEANRKRAEEVYKEERAIMEEVREGWESDRARMEDELRALVARMQVLERENKELKSMAAAGLGGYPTATLSAEKGSLQFAPGLYGVAAAAAVAHTRLVDSGALPTTKQPEAAASPTSIAPLASQSDLPHDDFLPSPRADDAPVPVIDVQTIHPELEGIPIKATAVQRSTFTDAAEQSPKSPKSDHKSDPKSDPTSDEMPPESRLDLKSASRSTSRPTSPTGPGQMAKRVVKVHTLAALAAGESQRLTMHAGHTPSHSLSILPTMTTSAATSTMADPSQGTTPTQAQVTASMASRILASAPDMPEHPAALDFFDDPCLEETKVVTPYQVDDDDLDHLPGPSGDARLKGPLMIRNIPAKDEEFWRLVNEKLEPISRNGSVPTVVEKAALDPQDSPATQVSHTAPARASTRTRAGGGGADDDSDDETEGQKEEDIPIRFKKTCNFGVPFGEM